MILRQDIKYPSRRTFVLKLRGDATPGSLAGRLENVVTGRQYAFESLHELVRSLEGELAITGVDAER